MVKYLISHRGNIDGPKPKLEAGKFSLLVRNSSNSLVLSKPAFSRKSLLNYFWHQGDTVTLTSKNYIWAHPGKQIIKGSIAVLPEIHNDNISKCIGICSDYIERYK